MNGLRLRDYQEIAADFLYEHDRAMILAPVGAGKTAITLRAMYDCLYNGVVQPADGVVPLEDADLLPEVREANASGEA